MAWPGSLTEEEQQSLLSFMVLLRAQCGEFARQNNHADVVNTEYLGPQNNTDGNLSKLSDTDVLPVSGGLDGAEPLTKAEVLTLLSYLQGCLAYNTAAHRQVLVKACGETNLIG